MGGDGIEPTFLGLQSSTLTTVLTARWQYSLLNLFKLMQPSVALAIVTTESKRNRTLMTRRPTSFRNQPDKPIFGYFPNGKQGIRTLMTLSGQLVQQTSAASQYLPIFQKYNKKSPEPLWFGAFARLQVFCTLVHSSSFIVAQEQR